MVQLSVVNKERRLILLLSDRVTAMVLSQQASPA